MHFDKIRKVSYYGLGITTEKFQFKILGIRFQGTATVQDWHSFFFFFYVYREFKTMKHGDYKIGKLSSNCITLQHTYLYRSIISISDIDNIYLLRICRQMSSCIPAYIYSWNLWVSMVKVNTIGSKSPYRKG